MSTKLHVALKVPSSRVPLGCVVELQFLDDTLVIVVPRMSVALVGCQMRIDEQERGAAEID